MNAVAELSGSRDAATPIRSTEAPPTNLSLIDCSTIADDEATVITAKESAGAVEQARRVVERNPRSAAALARLARTEVEIGDLEAAGVHARAALVLVSTSRDDPALVVAAQVLIASGDVATAEAALASADQANSSVSIAPSLLYAALAANRGDLPQAQARLSGVDPHDTVANALRGWLATRLGRYQEAIHLLRDASRDPAPNPATYINLGYAYAAIGSVRKAVRATRTAHQLAPAERIAALNLVGFYSRTGDLVSAIREIDRVHPYHPDDLSLDLTKVRVLLSYGQPKEARRELQSAQAARQFFASSRAIRADVKACRALISLQLRTQDRETTLRQLLDALRDSEFKNLTIARDLPLVSNQLHDASHIGEALSELRKFHPPSALFPLDAHLAWLELRFDDALQSVMKWLDHEPFSDEAAVMATYLLSVVKGDYTTAVRIGRAARVRMPANAVLANNLACSLAMVGDVREARRVLPYPEHQHLKPTAALIELAAGSLVESRRLYAEAANEADTRGDVASTLILWNEQLAEYRLGVGPKPDFSVVPADLEDSVQIASLRRGIEG